MGENSNTENWRLKYTYRAYNPITRLESKILKKKSWNQFLLKLESNFEVGLGFDKYILANLPNKSIYELKNCKCDSCAIIVRVK